MDNFSQMRRCETCAGELVFQAEQGFWKCQSCGNKYYIKDEKHETLVHSLNRAAELRHRSDFEGAIVEYTAILKTHPEDDEANWGMFISRCGIEYVKDDRTDEYIPTCHRTVKGNVLDNIYYKNAIKYGHDEQVKLYQAQAKRIAELQKEIKRKLDNEKDFDVFISFKSKDENGYPTKDASIARKIYDELNKVGIKTFFSDVTLKHRMGEQFEPIIYKALHSCKYFILVTTCEEHTNAVWVKNEWSRFRDRMDEEKMTNCAFAVFEGKDSIPPFMRQMQGFDLSHYPNGGYEDAVKDFFLSKFRNIEHSENTPNNSSNSIPRKKKKSKAIIPIIAFILAVAIGIGAFTVLNQGEAGTWRPGESQAGSGGENNTEKITESGTGGESEKTVSSLKNDMYNANVTSSSSGLPADGVLNIDEIKDGTNYTMVSDALPSNIETFHAFDISITSGGKPYSPKNEVTVTLPLPDDIDSSRAAVYYVSDAGVAEEYRCNVSGGNVNFVTTHFSIYVIAEKTPSEFSYTENTDGTLTITGYLGKENAFMIPESIDGKTVTAIESKAFSGKGSLTSVTIPDTVVSIGTNAFYGCTSIKSITIPESVDSMGVSVFYGWSSEQTVIISGRSSNPVEWNSKWGTSCDAKKIYSLKKIEFDPNSGSGNMSSVFSEMNQVATLPECTFEKYGFSFAGWSLSPDGEIIAEDGKGFNLGSDDIYTLYAVWSANENKLSFDPNGGAGDMLSMSIKTYQTVALNPCQFTRNGYAFEGWSTSPDGGVEYQDCAEYTMDGESEYILYAVWSIKDCMITYNLNGGDNHSSNPTGFDLNSEAIVLLPPTRAGYTFVGWYNSADFAEAVTIIETGTYSDVELWAKWEANSYTVTFDSNGGVETFDNMTVVFDSTYELPTPTREHFTFIGWYSGDVKYGVGAWQSTSDVTLTAKWTTSTHDIIYNDMCEVKMSIDIAFDLNYNGLIYRTVTLVNEEILMFPDIPFRTGYIFTGWYIDSACTELYEFDGTITDDMVLYAGWTQGECTVENNSEIPWTYSDGVWTSANKDSYSDSSLTIIADSPMSLSFKYRTSCESGYDRLRIYLNDVELQSATGENEYEVFTVSMEAGDRLNISYSKDGSSSYGDDCAYVCDISYSNVVPIESTAKISCASSDGLPYGYMEGSTYRYPVEYGSEYTLIVPVRPGYTFLGWYDENGNLAEGGTWDVVHDITLTPKWSVTPYVITLDANGGTVSETTLTVICGDSYVLPVPTRVGYIFEGWYYADEQITDGVWRIDADITLTAVWCANENISYKVNHYLQNANDDQYTLESSETFYGMADAEISPEVKSFEHFISPDVTYTTISPDGTLEVDYYYNRESYNLSYIVNGGDDIGVRAYKYEQLLIIETPTREGYTFGGWFNDKLFTSPYSPTATLNEDTTIYACWVEENNPQDFIYNGDYEIIITGYTGSNTTMWIPAYIGGIPVTYISENAFANNTGIVKAVVPETVVSIGSAAFSGCSALEDITLPFVGQTPYTAGYNGIFGYIFGYTYSYDHIEGAINQYDKYYYYIPQTIRSVTITSQEKIYDNAFKDCTFLEEINISDQATAFGKHTFSNCTSLKRMNSTTDGVFDLPAGIIRIGYNAFMNCILMEELILECVEYIESSAFEGNTSLKKITIPDGIRSIGSKAFKNCTALEAVTLGNTLESIDEYAFEGCAMITRINSDIDNTAVIPNGLYTIGNGAFKGLESIYDWTLPFVGNSALGSYESRVFGYVFGYVYSSTELEGATRQYGDYYYYYIPQTIKSVMITNQQTIPANAFENCNFIESISLSENTMYINGYAFYNCTSLKRVNSATDGEFNLSGSIAEIGYKAFCNCTLMESVTCTNVTTIYESTFEGSTALKSVNISDGILTIEKYAFRNCAALETVNIGKTLETIGEYAFDGCSLITKLNSGSDNTAVIPDSVTSIGMGAFKGLENIHNWTLPFVGYNATSTYDARVFGYIFGYTYDYYNAIDGTVTQYENAYHYHIPQTIKSVTITLQENIPDSAFENCSFIEEINIPENVTSIGAYAFNNCTSLKRVNSDTDGEFNIPDKVKEIKSHAFFNCALIEGFTCKGIETIQESAFEGAISLISADFSDAVLTSIGNYAFKNCSSLETVNLGGVLETIGEYAFDGCISINKINSSNANTAVVPDSVTSIGNGAFKGIADVYYWTLPFVGRYMNAEDESTVFGFIFGYTYTSDEVDGSIQQYINSHYKYTVPQTIKSVTITVQEKIPSYAFKNCSFIESINIHENVTSIGAYAFNNCTSLKRVNSDTDGEFNILCGEIKNFAFTNCVLIEKLICKNVQSIGQSAFEGALALISIELSDELLSIGSYAFKNCLLVETVSFGNVLETIGEYAFDGCISINKINSSNANTAVIPDSVTSIENGAFKGIADVYYWTLPFVGRYMNAEDESTVFGFVFGYTYTSGAVDGSIQQYINSYYKYTVPQTIKSVTITVQEKIPSYAFKNCSFIESINIHEEVTSIGKEAFYNCESLASINSTTEGMFNIPTGVSEIGNHTFYGCLLMEKLTCGNVRSIGESAFEGLVMLKDVNIPGGLISIEKKAFANCVSIETVNFGSSLERIGEYAFDGCISINKINSSNANTAVIPDSVTSIGNGAFKGIADVYYWTLPFVGRYMDAVDESTVFGFIFGYKYTSDEVDGSIQQYINSSYKYTVPQTIKSVTITVQEKIPSYAFKNCWFIESINISEAVTSIGEEAFYSCTGLKSLNSETDGVFNIPKGVKEINKSVFNKCKHMEEFTSGTITKIAQYAFYDLSELKAVIVPNGLISIGIYAFYNCKSIETLNLGKKLQTIGEHAFDGCISISKINSEAENTAIIPDTVTNIGNAAFKGVAQIYDWTLPFVGSSDSVRNETTVFGYIFGYEYAYSELNGTIEQYKDYHYRYYIPQTIKRVTISAQSEIPSYAFKNCSFIESIIFQTRIISTGDDAFQNCNANISYLDIRWNGIDVATEFGGGSGKESDPYVISNGSHLAYLEQQVRSGVGYEGIYFVISNDIMLGNHEVKTIGADSSHKFKGQIDGQGYSIRDFEITSDALVVGLFGYFSGKIENLKIEDASVTATRNTSGPIYVGSLVAYSEIGATIDNCYSNVTVTANCKHAVYAGGLVGYNGGLIQNSVAYGDVSAVSTDFKCFAGGLAANNVNTITGCEAYGEVTAQGYTEAFTVSGALVAENKGTIS